MDFLPLIYFISGAGGSFALWAVYGIPKVKSYFELRVVEEKAQMGRFFGITYDPETGEPSKTFKELVSESVPDIVEIAKDAVPSIVMAVKDALPAALGEMMPAVVESIKSYGAQAMGNLSSGQRSVVKAALNPDIGGGGGSGGFDLQKLMADPEIAKLAKQFGANPETAKNALGALGGGGNPGAGIIGSLIAQFVPSNYRPYIQAFLAKSGGGAIQMHQGQNGNYSTQPSGFNPGIGR